MNMLRAAIKIATKAHKGQKDKNGRSYIYHPLYVMSQMDTVDEMIVAVLHDVVEDTVITLQDLYMFGFNATVVHCVDLLTRTKRYTYKDYIRRLSTSPLAMRVKIQDVKNNMSPDRMSTTTMGLMRRYQWTLDYLLRST